MIWKPTFIKFTSILIAFATLVQALIILYNHFSGYLLLAGMIDFMIRWLIGSVLSLVILPFFSIPDLYMVSHFNRQLPWEKHWVIRISLELIFTVLIAAFGGSLVTILAHSLSPYREGLTSMIITNALIASVINLIIVMFLEAWTWYFARKKSENEKELLQSELNSMRFETLKQQINPHFMFNSLNVLSGLVHRDANLAEQFIEAFADVYRYVLETIEKPLVALSEEIQFSHAYFFLQQIRHGEGIEWEIDLPAEYMAYHLPPLSLQLLLENAIKHNAFSPAVPLTIQIGIIGKSLIVSNKLRKKTHLAHSSGVGLANLKKRYAHISAQVPDFKLTDHNFIAVLPLIP
ncbi:MAG: histidine kinase [Cyclobacteriaceae bacterium]|nr:histidine kinase [Cyclobacteriaceae bacterium]